jgi:hypothetical protein
MNTNRHYTVDRRSRFPGSERIGDIERLVCGHYRFVVFLRPYRRGTDRSGLPKYNRARAVIVKHLHQQHKDKLNQSKEA